MAYGYVIAHINIHDPEGYATYVKMVQPTLDLLAASFWCGVEKPAALKARRRAIGMLSFNSPAMTKRWIGMPRMLMRQPSSKGSLPHLAFKPSLKVFCKVRCSQPADWVLLGVVERWSTWLLISLSACRYFQKPILNPVALWKTMPIACF